MGLHCPWVINKNCLGSLVKNFMLSSTEGYYLFFPLLPVFESLSLCESTVSTLFTDGTCEKKYYYEI